MSKKNKKEVVEVKQPNQITSFIQQAIENKLPVETMERLFQLQKDVKAERAREDFVMALAKFQKDIPVIKKTKAVMNRDGKTVRYKYAPLEDVIEQVKEYLSDNGFSYNWDTEKNDDHIKVVCRLTHIAGHFQTSSFEIPIVASNYMSKPQTYATAQTFAKRYTFLNVTGIGTAEEDTDAIDTGKDEDVKDQKAKIMMLLKRLGHETDNKKQIKNGVKQETKLDLKEENFEEIVDKLTIITNEQGI